MNFQPVLDSLTKIITNIADFIPLLVNGLIILLIGYLISVLVRAIVRFVFRRIGVDELAEKAGINRVIKELRLPVALSKILALVIFYFLLLSFATEAMRVMRLESIAELLSNILRFIPKAIGAGIIMVLGSMLARFLGETITAVSENVNITYGGALGKILEYAIVAFVAVLAISTLGLDTTIFTTNLTIIIGCVGLAFTLTFGLGSRETARNIIAGYSVQQKLQPGQQITFGPYTGTLRSTSGAYTTLEIISEQGEVEELVLPNTLLLQKISRITRNQAKPQEPDNPPSETAT
jgi:small-conductance mechanosensitive channel